MYLPLRIIGLQVVATVEMEPRTLRISDWYDYYQTSLR
jgi:hypothetical protein